MSSHHSDIIQIKSDIQGKQKSIDATLNISEEEWEERLSDSKDLKISLLSKLEQLIAINNETSSEVKMNRLLLFSQNFDSLNALEHLSGPEVQMWFENLEELKTFLNEYENSLIEERRKRKHIDNYLK